MGSKLQLFSNFSYQSFQFLYADLASSSQLFTVKVNRNAAIPQRRKARKGVIFMTQENTLQYGLRSVKYPGAKS